MGLKGVKVNGQAYNFDYGYLENKPIPANPGNNSTSVVDVDAMVLAKDGNDIEWRKVLPSTGTGDEGKVLTVDECGFPAWMTPSGGGAGGAWQHVPYWDPEDIGKVLTITSDSGLEWTTMESGGGSGGGTSLPPYDEDDAGKALLVSDNGGLVWDHAIPTTECFMPDTFGIMTVTGDIENMEWAPVQRDLLGFPPIENVNRAVLVAYDDDDYGTSMWWEELDEDLLLAMLPSFGPDDNGKVLMTNGRYVFWDNPS